MKAMPSVTPKSPTHVPAWKKIGLKLKLSEVHHQFPEDVIVEDHTLKRKLSAISAEDNKSNKVQKISTALTHSKDHASTPPFRSKKKSVKFTAETKAEDGDSIKKLFKTWSSKRGSFAKSGPLFSPYDSTDNFASDDVNCEETGSESSSKVKNQNSDITNTSSEPDTKPKSQSNEETQPFLKYLKTYHESRETWKFNKTHQIHLLQHVFDVNVMPIGSAHLIYAYINGLKGQARTRLRDTAIAIKVDDQEKCGAGLPSDMSNESEIQRDYEDAIAKYIANCTTSDARKPKHEEDFLSGLKNLQLRVRLKERIIRRIRAEMILNELASSSMEAYDSTSQKTETKECVEDNQPRNIPKEKEVRKRKQRTLIVEDSSSDESDTDTDEAVAEAVSSDPSSKSSDSDSESESESGSSSNSSSESDT